VCLLTQLAPVLMAQAQVLAMVAVARTQEQSGRIWIVWTQWQCISITRNCPAKRSGSQSERRSDMSTVEARSWRAWCSTPLVLSIHRTPIVFMARLVLGTFASSRRRNYRAILVHYVLTLEMHSRAGIQSRIIELRRSASTLNCSFNLEC
jgi:hypothetical protein